MSCILDEQRKNELINEILYSLPSKNLLNDIAIAMVSSGETLIILKSRGISNEDTLKIALESSPTVIFDGSTKNLYNRNVVFTTDDLSSRAIPVISELKEHSKPSFKYNMFNVIIGNHG